MSGRGLAASAKGSFPEGLHGPCFSGALGGPAVTSETGGTSSIGPLDNQDDHELYSSKLLKLTFELPMHKIGQSAT